MRFIEGKLVVNRSGVYFSLEGVRQDIAVSNNILLFACLSGVKWLNNGGARWVTTVRKPAEGSVGGEGFLQEFLNNANTHGDFD